MVEFPLGRDGGLFRPVIEIHDNRIGDLRWMQGLFREAEVARALSDYLHEDYPRHADWQSYWNRNRGLAESAFRNPRRGVTRHAFDPWTGWWTGMWHQADGSTAPQKHVWDETQPSAAGNQGTRHIQPVTQSVSAFFHSGNAADGWGAGDVDLGINVVSEDLGITGWVSKRQGGNRVELPHVGYLLNPHTLIWITSDRDVRESATRFMMFFEWIAADRQSYGIHGRFFALSGGRISRAERGLAGWSRYSATRPVR